MACRVLPPSRHSPREAVICHLLFAICHSTLALRLRFCRRADEPRLHHRGFQAEIEVLELMSDEELWNDDY